MFLGKSDNSLNYFYFFFNYHNWICWLVFFFFTCILNFHKFFITSHKHFFYRIFVACNKKIGALHPTSPKQLAVRIYFDKKKKKKKHPTVIFLSFQAHTKLEQTFYWILNFHMFKKYESLEDHFTPLSFQQPTLTPGRPRIENKKKLVVLYKINVVQFILRRLNDLNILLLHFEDMKFFFFLCKN